MQSKDAQTKQRKLKDAHSTGLNQIDVMNDLVQLLQVKIGTRFACFRLCGLTRLNLKF
jgi:hypothetical protein